MRDGKISSVRNVNLLSKGRVYDALHAEDGMAPILYGNILRRIFSSHLACGDTVLEGGAFLGGHTLAMVDQVAPLGRVIAFEASAHAAAALRTRADAEDLADAIDIRHAAIADYNGHAEFSRVPAPPQPPDRPPHPGLPQAGSSQPWSSAIRARAIDFTIEGGEVPVVRLDDGLEPGHPVRMLVLDLAGGELAALRGARRILAEERPLILFRHAGSRAAAAHGYTAEEFRDFFDAIDYELHDILGFRFDVQDWSTGRRPNWYLGVPGEDHVSKGTLHGMIEDVVHQHGLSAAFS